MKHPRRGHLEEMVSACSENTVDAVITTNSRDMFRLAAGVERLRVNMDKRVWFIYALLRPCGTVPHGVHGPSLSFSHSRFYKLCPFCVWCPACGRCVYMPECRWSLSPPCCTEDCTRYSFCCCRRHDTVLQCKAWPPRNETVTQGPKERKGVRCGPLYNNALWTQKNPNWFTINHLFQNKAKPAVSSCESTRRVFHWLTRAAIYLLTIFFFFSVN